jgi:hypothetical protein
MVGFVAKIGLASDFTILQLNPSLYGAFAGLRQSLLGPLAAALVGRASEAAIARHRPLVAQLPRQNLRVTHPLQRHYFAVAAMAASAAAMPLRQAPWAVEKSCREHASPAKNSLPATGAARTLRASACPGRAWE